MIFKKEDLGLYFALGLTGAGIGLLVGAFVASKQKKAGILVEREEPVIKIDHKTFEERSTMRKEFAKAYQPNSEDSFTLEEKAFFAEFEPSAVQMQMYMSELVTLEQLRNVITEERMVENSEPYPYGSSYDAEKPDLEELVPDLVFSGDLIDGRYFVDFEPIGGEVLKEFLFRQRDESFFFISGRGNLVGVSDITKFIPEEAWLVALDLLVTQDQLVYVSDNDKMVSYKVELMDDNLDHEKDDSVK